MGEWGWGRADRIDDGDQARASPVLADHLHWPLGERGVCLCIQSATPAKPSPLDTAREQHRGTHHAQGGADAAQLDTRIAYVPVHVLHHPQRVKKIVRPHRNLLLYLDLDLKRRARPSGQRGGRVRDGVHLRLGRCMYMHACMRVCIYVCVCMCVCVRV
jgi:hypothetical protein